MQLSDSTKLRSGGVPLSTTPVVVTTAPTTPPTFGLTGCANYSSITATVISPASGFNAIMTWDDTNGSPYYDSALNPKTPHIAVMDVNTAVVAATISLSVTLAECNNFAGGFGTVNSNTPFEIANDIYLDRMRRLVNAYDTYAGAHYKLTANIDMGQLGAPWAESTGGNGFGVIGRDSTDPQIIPNNQQNNLFTGSLDCSDYEISRLYINYSSTDTTPAAYGLYVGLFGAASNARIENCTLRDAKITGGNYVGGIVGAQFGGTFSGNHIIDSSIIAISDVGSIVGYKTDGTLSNNHISNTTLYAEASQIGGIIGLAKSGLHIENSVTDVSITASGGSYAGGINGSNSNASNRSNTVSHTVLTGYYGVGGIVG